LDIQNTENADVLILSGDICVAKTLLDQDGENMKESRSVQGMSNRFHEFFQQACSEFKNVVYVMGNHEHYDGDFATTESTIRSKLGYLKNLHLAKYNSAQPFICFGAAL
jgi:predicted phosphodiesterase